MLPDYFSHSLSLPIELASAGSGAPHSRPDATSHQLETAAGFHCLAPSLFTILCQPSFKEEEKNTHHILLIPFRDQHLVDCM